MSSDFEAAVEKALPTLSKECFRHFGTTSVGQRYVIIATKGIWYKVRLFLEEDHLDKHCLEEFDDSEHLTLKGANEWAEKMQRKLSCVSIDGSCLKAKIIELPNDCKENPDRYLHPGDHVQITRKGGAYTHDAVYIGNRKVNHIFMDEGESKTSACAREDPWSKYVGFDEDGTVPWLGTITVVVYRLRFRNPDEIIKEAKRLCELKHGLGNYNLMDQNCQHFATFCVIGREVSFDQMKVVLLSLSIGEVLRIPSMGGGYVPGGPGLA